MHMNAESLRILLNPSPQNGHGITSNPPTQSTAASLFSAPQSTKSTCCLCTKLLTQVLHPPVMLLSKLSSAQGQTDLLYSCWEATNLLTGFLIYQLALPSVKSYWWVHNSKPCQGNHVSSVPWHCRPVGRCETRDLHAYVAPLTFECLTMLCREHVPSVI